MSLFDMENRPEPGAEAPAAVCWPQWTEEARLDDALAAAAYEATPAHLRAAVKTGLALAHMHFGECTTSQRNEIRNTHLGFWRRSIAHPAPWAVIAFTPAYAAAARLAAACMPALLGGVPLVGAVCVGGAPGNNALVTLELAGVEDIFVMDSAGLCTLLEETQPGPGRLVLLHRGELDGVAGAARTLELPCYEERRSTHPCASPPTPPTLRPWRPWAIAARGAPAPSHIVAPPRSRRAARDSGCIPALLPISSACSVRPSDCCNLL